MSGMQFDRWSVLPEYRYKNGRKQWLCVCSCADRTAKYVDAQNLLSGHSKSCGCLSREMRKDAYLDLTGRRFGALVAKTKAENRNGRTAWNCECDCGNFVVVTTHELVQGKTKSCGCHIHRIGKYIRELTNMDLGAMEALYPTEKRDAKGSVIWHCRCKKCGREKELSEDVLVHGNYKSCGCTRYENSNRMVEYMHFYRGTCLEALQRKIRIDNTTGVVGVTTTKSGRYKAGITFQGKPYSLGIYDTLEEAASARRSAEEQLHKSFIQSYTAWMQSPEDTKEEFVFEVNYISGEFLIYSNYPPEMVKDK
ncbi:MAG: hypothetical protein RR791_00120 [Lachnospiraceae bacterium]